METVIDDKLLLLLGRARPYYALQHRTQLRTHSCAADTGELSGERKTAVCESVVGSVRSPPCSR